MRYTSLLLPLAALIWLPARPGPGAGWKTIVPPDKAFSVQFPGSPSEQTKKLKTETGTIHVKFYLLEPEEGSPGYFLSFSEMASGSAKAPGPQARLDGAKKGALASTQGKLVSEKKITLGKYPGAELLIATAAANFLRTRIWVVDQRVYQVFVVGDRGQVEGANAEKFLRSFKVQGE